MRRRPAVIGLDNLLCDYREPSDRDKLEIERRLLILHEASIERATAGLMTGIAGCDSESARKRRPIACSWRPDGFRDGPIQPASALLQILSGPVVRKRYGEADAVSLAIGSGSAIDDAIDTAARG